MYTYLIKISFLNAIMLKQIYQKLLVLINGFEKLFSVINICIYCGLLCKLQIKATVLKISDTETNLW